MLRAVVVDNVWATRRLAELPNGAFLEVQVEDTGARLVAFDVLGSGIGERVLVAQGSVAAAWFPGKPPPLDALIVGSIDEPSRAPQVAAEPVPAHAERMPVEPVPAEPVPAPPAATEVAPVPAPPDDPNGSGGAAPAEI
jgi:ethanolamine utilization protein EutN